MQALCSHFKRAVKRFQGIQFQQVPLRGCTAVQGRSPELHWPAPRDAVVFRKNRRHIFGKKIERQPRLSVRVEQIVVLLGGERLFGHPVVGVEANKKAVEAQLAAGRGQGVFQRFPERRGSHRIGQAGQELKVGTLLFDRKVERAAGIFSQVDHIEAELNSGLLQADRVGVETQALGVDKVVGARVKMQADGRVALKQVLVQQGYLGRVAGRTQLSDRVCERIADRRPIICAAQAGIVGFSKLMQGVGKTEIYRSEIGDRPPRGRQQKLLADTLLRRRTQAGKTTHDHHQRIAALVVVHRRRADVEVDCAGRGVPEDHPNGGAAVEQFEHLFVARQLNGVVGGFVKIMDIGADAVASQLVGHALGVSPDGCRFPSQAAAVVDDAFHPGFSRQGLRRALAQGFVLDHFVEVCPYLRRLGDRQAAYGK